MSARKHNPRSRLLMTLRAKIMEDPGIADHEIKQEAIKQLEPVYREVYAWLWERREWAGSLQVAAALGLTTQRAGEILHGLYDLGFLAKEKRTIDGRLRNGYRTK